METTGLIESFQEFKEFKDIDRETLMKILEDVFRNMIQKKYGSDDNYDFIINIDKGDLEVWRNRTIVQKGEVEDDNREISYEDAIKIEPDFEVGEEVSEEVKLLDFGRRAVLSVRQNLISRVLDIEKEDLFETYKEKVGTIVTGEVYQIWKREILILDDEENELVYRIVGSDESSVASGKISYESPIARALMGKAPGDEVVVQTPKGKRTLEIIEVHYC